MEGSRRGRVSLDEWMRWQPSGRRGRLSALVLTPARVVVGIGAGAAIVGGLMPWAEGTAPGHRGFEPVFFSGLGGAGDGLVIVILSAAIGFLTLHRLPALSRVRTVRLAPAVFVVLAAITWVNGYRATLLEIEAWERRGGQGAVAPGLWLVGIGIVAMAAGTLWLLPPVLRWRREADDPADLVRIRARDVAVVLAGIAGVVPGAAIGVAIGLELTGPMILGTLAFGALIGGMFGAYGGAWAMRWLLDRLDRGRGA
jgi:hypothetical protein